MLLDIHSSNTDRTHLLKEAIPISSQAFLFILTYVCESLRSPTMTTASPGTCSEEAPREFDKRRGRSWTPGGQVLHGVVAQCRRFIY